MDVVSKSRYLGIAIQEKQHNPTMVNKYPLRPVELNTVTRRNNAATDIRVLDVPDNFEKLVPNKHNMANETVQGISPVPRHFSL